MNMVARFTQTAHIPTNEAQAHIPTNEAQGMHNRWHKIMTDRSQRQQGDYSDSNQHLRWGLLLDNSSSNGNTGRNPTHGNSQHFQGQNEDYSFPSIRQQPMHQQTAYRDFQQIQGSAGNHFYQPTAQLPHAQLTHQNGAQIQGLQADDRLQPSHPSNPRTPQLTLDQAAKRYLPHDYQPVQQETKGKSLPSEFVPDNWTCICGRGKTATEHIGNRRLRVLVEANLESYGATTKKIDRGIIVSAIVSTVQSAASVAGFVRHDQTTNQWLEVGDDAAREKVGQLLREALTKKDPAKSLARRMRRRARAAKARGAPSSTDQVPQESLRGELLDPTCRRQRLLDKVNPFGGNNPKSKSSPMGSTRSNSPSKGHRENT